MSATLAATATSTVHTCGFGDGIRHAAPGDRDASHGRSEQIDSTLWIGVQSWQGFPKDMQVRFTVDRPALIHQSTTFHGNLASLPGPTRLQ